MLEAERSPLNLGASLAANIHSVPEEQQRPKAHMMTERHLLALSLNGPGSNALNNILLHQQEENDDWHDPKHQSRQSQIPLLRILTKQRKGRNRNGTQIGALQDQDGNR